MTARRVVEAPLPQPLEGGASDVQLVERASAAPLHQPALRARRRAARTTGPAARARLADVQRWFQAVITDPRSVERGVRAQAAAGALGVREAGGLERIVTAGPRLAAADRLRIYHYAYHARLIDCLADDFPTLRYALGERAFRRLAADVIAARPSRRANLNGYGASLVAHLADAGARTPRRAFAGDLARLEWALVEAVHAAPAPALDAAALRAIPAERWPRARFRPSASLRVLEFAYPVDRFLQAFRDERAPAIPARAWSSTAVYRRGWTVWRMDLTRPMAAILNALIAGETLGDALATLARTTTRAERGAIEARVMRWFGEWVSGGCFAAVRV